MSSLVTPAAPLARPDRVVARIEASADAGELLTKRRPIDFGRVATCLCRRV
ncbi:MAG TPA: hypothetical protein VJT31_00290 [Rugosimonospora sp.]|nr:hypothetical protein [Rugosimonospora sp.]